MRSPTVTTALLHRWNKSMRGHFTFKRRTLGRISANSVTYIPLEQTRLLHFNSPNNICSIPAWISGAIQLQCLAFLENIS